MISIDTSRPLRNATQLAVLVDAVVAAGEHDESDWIEWKSHLDLLGSEGPGVIAKAIVGFANRDPAVAQLKMGGCGYLLVGVGPDHVEGVETVDTAILVPGIDRYLAEPRPVYQVEYVKHRDANVLVVVVDPPRNGDCIHCLAKQVDRLGPGSVVVRDGTRTMFAEPRHLRRLEDRLLATVGSLDLKVEPLEGAVVPLDISEEAVSAWLDANAHQLLGPLEREEGMGDQALRLGIRVPQPGSIPGMNSFIMTHYATEEDRTPDEFRRQVTAFLGDLETGGALRAIANHIEDGSCAVEMRLVNETDRPFTDVHVTIEVAAGTTTLFSGAPFAQLPAPPRSWGPYIDRPFENRYLPTQLMLGENRGTSMLEYRFERVLPRKSYPLGPVHVIADPALAGGALTLAWTARSGTSTGVVGGEFEFEVSATVAVASDLLRGAPRSRGPAL